MGPQSNVRAKRIGQGQTRRHTTKPAENPSLLSIPSSQNITSHNHTLQFTTKSTPPENQQATTIIHLLFPQLHFPHCQTIRPQQGEQGKETSHKPQAQDEQASIRRRSSTTGRPQALGRGDDQHNQAKMATNQVKL